MYGGLGDLILRDQLTLICNKGFEHVLSESDLKLLEQATKLADQSRKPGIPILSIGHL